MAELMPNTGGHSRSSAGAIPPDWVQEVVDAELQKKIIDWHIAALADVEARHKEERAKAQAQYEEEISEIKQLYRQRMGMIRGDLQKALTLSQSLDIQGKCACLYVCTLHGRACRRPSSGSQCLGRAAPCRCRQQK